MDGPKPLTESGGALRRNVSFPLLVLYGLGTTVGAGVYALVGEVAGLAGLWAPWSFLLASALATATALAFAELSSRLPKAAGEAAYVRAAFDSERGALLVGIAVVVSGTISAGAVSNGFAGYVSSLTEWPRIVSITALVVVLGGVAAWGIRESLRLAAIVTLLEVGGLVAVAAAVGRQGVAPLLAGVVPEAPLHVGGVVAGATLAFYAFLGFEDMVNVAEEVEDVRRTLPRAILWTLALTAMLYGAVALVAVVQVPPSELAASDAPLALVYERAVGRAPLELVVIGSLAMVNGALIQIIMASRVLYGLSRGGLLAGALGRVNARTGTPLVATLVVAFAVWALAAVFPLARLARGTALIALGVFTSAHAALFVLQRRPGPEPAFTCPRWIPIAGGATSLLLIALELHRLL